LLCVDRYRRASFLAVAGFAFAEGSQKEPMPMQDLDEALRMLDVFASVGAERFDLTHIDIDGEKRGFRPAKPSSR